MSTTELFVELIIIGVGAILWIYLLIISAFGFSKASLDQLTSLATLIPLLSITYVTGIVIDRIADTIFEQIWTKKIFRKFYNNKKDYYEDRRIIYIHEGRLASLLEYGRSRLRICRGWVLNSILILLALNLFVWTRIPDFGLKFKLSMLGSLFCVLLLIGTFFSWYRLTLIGYRKVKGQSDFLRQLKSKNQK